MKEVSKMGYVLHVSKWEKSPPGKITVTIENRGVAPWYFSWPLQSPPFPAQSYNPNAFMLPPIQPGESCQRVIDLESQWTGRELRLSVPNPMKGGKNLRFANEEQGDLWLTLGRY